MIMTLIHIPLGFAAVGCTLNDPERDIKKIFPKSTGYKTEFITIEERGGHALQQEIEECLGDTFDPVYETIDVPYAYYIVLEGKNPIGRIHGINQKGTYGGLQIILATDLDGKIIDFYYQRLSSPEAKKFRNKEFAKKFIGLTLENFYTEDKNKTIEDPSLNSHQDFLNTLRGIKKNLIMLDKFHLNNQYSKDFCTQERLKDEN